MRRKSSTRFHLHDSFIWLRLAAPHCKGRAIGLLLSIRWTNIADRKNKIKSRGKKEENGKQQTNDLLTKIINKSEKKGKRSRFIGWWMSLVILKKLDTLNERYPKLLQKGLFLCISDKDGETRENTDRWYYTHLFRVHSYPPISHLTLDYVNLTRPITKCKEFFHVFPSLPLHMSWLCKYHFWHEAQM